MTIAGFDNELFQAMEEERQRQEDHIELIASENYTSPRVMEALGSQLTNKYAKVTPVNVITVVVSLSIKLNSLPSTAPRPCLAPITRTSNRIQAHRPIWRFSWR